MLVSQPVVGSPSQSPKGSLQRATPHRPPAHAGTPLRVLQSDPQAPQCVASAAVSTHPPPQQARPSGQPRAASQPGTQARSTQRVPMGQCSLARHCTHAWIVRSQRPTPTPASMAPPSEGALAQPWSLLHPEAQVLSEAQ
nr:hypothetical protein [Deltaproteobacteria bacterium]